MKKYLFSFVAILIFIIVSMAIYINITNNAIKKSDIWQNVTINNYLPNMNSKAEASVSVYLEDSDEYYFFFYIGDFEGSPLFYFEIEKDKQEIASYWYSWESKKINESKTIPEGWYIYDSENDTIHKVDDIPLYNINGEVTYTSGNTSLIKRCLGL